MTLLDAYRTWRRAVFPASKNDLDWRVGELGHRLDKLQDRLDDIARHQAAAAPFSQAASHSGVIGGSTQGLPETQRYLLDLLRLLSPQEATGVAKARVGSAYDGGYVQLDDVAPLRLALSLGVGDNDSWDVAMAEKGLSVHQFDHTIVAAPSTHPNLTFHRKKVSTAPSATDVTLGELLADVPADSASVILKMDIEGAEWSVLENASKADLSKLAQFVCEFHDLSRLSESGFNCRARAVFEKLNEVFSVVHVHANNFGSLVNIANVVVPDVIELSFASRRRYAFAPSQQTFPTPLDSANDPARPDIFLGRFQF